MARTKKIKHEEEEQAAGESFSARLGEFGSAVLQIADEKSIAREKVIEVVEAALAAAYKKDYGKRGQVIRAQFDEVAKTAQYFLVKEVVDETVRDFSVPSEDEEIDERPELPPVAKAPEEATASTLPTPGTIEEERLPRFNAERDIIIEDARKIKKGVLVGDTVEMELPAHEEFGRVAAQTAKQVIIQRIREAEREAMFREYKEREGEVANGTIQRVEGRLVFVDLGKSVGVMFPSEQVEGERYVIGSRLKVYILRVESDPKGPGITLSRAHSAMVEHLFQLEVPEIASGVVVVKAIAREAGSRTKIAVFSDEEGVDPIGSCVGQKGTRVQSVIDELHGEKIDIIQWNENAEKFIRAALAPAKVLAVTLNEEARSAAVIVPEDQLSLAIGRRGQNVRLAAKLTGWRIDVSGTGAVETASTVQDGSTDSTEESSAEVAPAQEVTDEMSVRADAVGDSVTEDAVEAKDEE